VIQQQEPEEVNVNPFSSQIEANNDGETTNTFRALIKQTQDTKKRIQNKITQSISHEIQRLNQTVDETNDKAPKNTQKDKPRRKSKSERKGGAKSNGAAVAT